MSKQVIALYQEHTAAALAVDNLTTQGNVSVDDISVVVSDASKGKHFDIEVNTKIPEGAATGAAVGGALGAVAAGLTAVGVVAAPGIGLVAAGPVLASLAGAGAGAAAGGLTGGLIGSGIPEHEAKVVSDSVSEGNILILVDSHDNHVDEVKNMLENTGAKSVH